MKDERLLEELKARLDIVEVISDYVELKRAGQNYKGLCPFHSEKTPSFMVSPDKQIFHCFGCGVGGNVIQFMMKYENLSFPESLRLLARKAGIDLKEFKLQPADDGPREKLLEIHAVAAKVFADNLRKSKTATSYLQRRGLAEDTIRSFSLGYASKDWHHLSNYLKEKGFSRAAVLQSGLVSSGEKGIYDTFRDRIMFPIVDLQGGIIAFGGRVMDESQPKYLNSPDTPLFKKGETLYGLSHAKDGVRKKGYAVIVEGYFDAIVCHQYGFTNAAAPLGTALTPGHLQRLKRFTKKALLVFDGDEAGKAAAKRSIPLLLEQGFTAKLLLLPTDDDPDSFLRKNGEKRFADLIAGAVSPIDFVISVSKGDRTETVHEALGMIAAAGDAIMKEELVRELSEKTGLRETVLREEMEGKGKRSKKIAPLTSSSTPSARGFCYDEELLLLSAVIAFPEKLAALLRDVPAGEFSNPTVRRILEKVCAGRPEESIESILSSLGDEEKALVTKLTFHPGFDHEAVERNIEDCVRSMVERRFAEQRTQIHERIRQAEKRGDQELLYSLLKERQKLMKEAR
jgi:DNA primase